jgi:hypothetical protein
MSIKKFLSNKTKITSEQIVSKSGITLFSFEKKKNFTYEY